MFPTSILPGFAVPLLPTGAPSYTIPNATIGDVEVYEDAAKHIIGALSTDKWGGKFGVAFPAFPDTSVMLLEVIGGSSCVLRLSVDKLFYTIGASSGNKFALIDIYPVGPIYVPKILVKSRIGQDGNVQSTSTGRLDNLQQIAPFIGYEIREIFSGIRTFAIFNQVFEAFKAQHGDLSYNPTIMSSDKLGWRPPFVSLSLAGAVGRAVAWGLGGLGAYAIGVAVAPPVAGLAATMALNAGFASFGVGYSASMWADFVTLMEDNWTYLTDFEPVEVGPGPDMSAVSDDDDSSPDMGAKTGDDTTGDGDTDTGDGGGDTNPKPVLEEIRFPLWNGSNSLTQQLKTRRAD